MNFNFELILFYLVVICGLISLYDIIFLAKRRAITQKKMNIISEYGRSFFPILLLVFLMRSFWFEPFRIPSGSLEPTLLIGDFIAVNKYHYGIRLPVTHEKIMKLNEPLRGDIIVFRWPANPSFDFIKRVIGLPGDHVSYVNRVLTINGHEIPQTFEKNLTMADEFDVTNNLSQLNEDLLGVKHDIYIIPNRPNYDFKDIVVPDHMYFVMGDNRDESADSRYWGFVPEDNIVGKASLIWMSWDSSLGDQPEKLMRFWDYVRWNRLFKTIH